MTRKLLTPVQYESVLGGLNKARPLSLVDEGRVILSSPVLDSIPVNDDRPVQGKFLRSADGSSLKSNPNVYDGYRYEHESLFAISQRPKIYTFDPPTEGVLLRVVAFVYPAWCYWRNTSGADYIIRYQAAGCFWVPFTGVIMHWLFQTGAAGLLEIELFAFYGKDI